MKKRTVLGLYFLLLCIVGCSQQPAKYPFALEIIDKTNKLNEKQLIAFCKENMIDESSIYKWENHWLIYAQSLDAEISKKLLEKQFTGIEIKVYDKPFYNFNRQTNCHAETAMKWDNIIMTANLVEDTSLQKEYMEYHKTQFEKWPEVSNGFCHANFQQLLVFRNGRQLLLIISIPKGESLDHLNPKTTENNPRVDEWNILMGNYQVGIDDAPKGTTWVMFSPLSR